MRTLKSKKLIKSLFIGTASTAVVAGCSTFLSNCSQEHWIDLSQWDITTKAGGFSGEWSLDEYTNLVAENFDSWFVNNLFNYAKIYGEEKTDNGQIVSALVKYSLKYDSAITVFNETLNQKELSIENFSFKIEGNGSLDGKNANYKLDVSFDKVLFRFNNITPIVINEFLIGLDLGLIDIDFVNLKVECSYETSNVSSRFKEEYLNTEEYIRKWNDNKVNLLKKVIVVENISEEQYWVYIPASSLEFPADTYLGNYLSSVLYFE